MRKPASPAAALTALWAHAACSVRDGSPAEARRIATFLTERLRDFDDKYAEMPAPPSAPGEEQRPGYQPLSPTAAALLAAARWCARANQDIAPTIPRAACSRTVNAVARWLVAQPGTDNWIYRGGSEDVEERIWSPSRCLTTAVGYSATRTSAPAT